MDWPVVILHKTNQNFQGCKAVVVYSFRRTITSNGDTTARRIQIDDHRRVCTLRTIPNNGTLVRF
jgi:hypothetical protein